MERLLQVRWAVQIEQRRSCGRRIAAPVVPCLGAPIKRFLTSLLTVSLLVQTGGIEQRRSDRCWMPATGQGQARQPPDVG